VWVRGERKDVSTLVREGGKKKRANFSCAEGECVVGSQGGSKRVTGDVRGGKGALFLPKEKRKGGGNLM